MLVVHAKKFQLVNWVPTKLGKILFHGEVDLLNLGNMQIFPLSCQKMTTLHSPMRILGKDYRKGKLY